MRRNSRSLLVTRIRLADLAWAADLRRMRHIGDLRECESHDKYKEGFERLMRDLRTGEKAKG